MNIFLMECCTCIGSFGGESKSLENILVYISKKIVGFERENF
ncbi:hypothetical protein LMANV2_270013 [Leptospira interrogans serovar Manilae]|uniref:Uncharacterized protein n=1 Tax=Leptospira interrogans serovar Manilae TaxID=214675 RepID=A0AAQ1NWR0_LEPIR|nr:hypothetical protein LMANV2_270013 [Leptospira interrogans serovar Manilae]